MVPTLVPSFHPSGFPSLSPSLSEMPSTRSVCSQLRSDATLLFNENFENGSLTGWTGATIESGAQSSFSKFLGRFGMGQRPSKVFTLPPSIRNVRVEFLFYEIDSWDGNNSRYGPDKFFVYINNFKVDLGFFSQSTSESASGNIGGILWSHSSISSPASLGFLSFSDQKHSVTLDIPLSYLQSGSLKIDFEAGVSEGALNETGGVDDLKIFGCPS
jgi:large repetitive protein